MNNFNVSANTKLIRLNSYTKIYTITFLQVIRHIYGYIITTARTQTNRVIKKRSYGATRNSFFYIT